ncbi:type II secretion system protein GspN [Desulfopila sp. IMCC35008]|uniref:type II secretion system protein GspN n=1 Tax=Desulfopila sp. IMCC35008 TaxID=2653858 RepID=UPI0013D4E5B0|nr:type II secretion system protein GspN [Desulfopila sp. IMCC35008]
MAMMVPVRRLFIYFMYGLLLTGVLLYVRFPKEEAGDFLARKLEAAFPAIECSFGPAGYVAPYSVLFKHLLVSRRIDGNPLIMFKDVQVTPTLEGLGRAYTVTATLHGGTVRTEVMIYPFRKDFEFSGVEVAGVRFEELESLTSGVKRELFGTFGVTGQYSGSWQEGAKGKGSGQYVLVEGKTVLRQPILTLRELEIKQVTGDFQYTDKNITLTNGVMKTDGFTADYGGNVQVIGRFSGWRLGLNGNLEIEKEFLKKKPRILRVVKRLQKQYQKNQIPFYMKGTTGNPRFAFGSG